MRIAVRQRQGRLHRGSQGEAEGRPRGAGVRLQRQAGRPGQGFRVAQAETTYAVAKERCDDKAGNAKDVCVQEAKAAETKALADAKLGKVVGAARTDAAQDKRDADYKVQLEKCDALAGDAKTGCVATAKSTFGKT